MSDNPHHKSDGATLLIRADASPRMGTGHVMRCLALAQEWQKAGPVVFALAQCTSALEERLSAEGFQIRKLSAEPGSAEDAEETIALALQNGTAWVVVDGYHFGADYQQAIKVAGLRLLFFDDYGHASSYCADMVLNQNLGADAGLYIRREPQTHLLLGTPFCVLRKEFLVWRGWKREIPAVAHKVLVTLGGSDPDNVTGKVVDALHGLDVDAKIVVGGSNPHVEQFKSELRTPNSKFELIVDAKSMPRLMAWADVAVAAGGSTSWELAFMGLPSIVIVLAKNQIDVANRLHSEGVSINLGEFSKLRPEQIAGALRSLLDDAVQRSVRTRAGRQLVDGNGAARVITRLRAADVTLRLAGIEDSRLLWEWANDPVVRSSAFSPEPIPWEVHQKWFSAKLDSPGCKIFIGTNGRGKPFGQVRFSWDCQGEAEVDVHVDAHARQCGLGSALICAGVEEALKIPSLKTVHAHIKTDNVSSMRAFEKAGFRDAGIIVMRGQQAHHLTLTR